MQEKKCKKIFEKIKQNFRKINKNIRKKNIRIKISESKNKNKTRIKLEKRSLIKNIFNEILYSILMLCNLLKEKEENSYNSNFVLQEGQEDTNDRIFEQ